MSTKFENPGDHFVGAIEKNNKSITTSKKVSPLSWRHCIQYVQWSYGGVYTVVQWYSVTAVTVCTVRQWYSGSAVTVCTVTEWYSVANIQ